MNSMLIRESSTNCLSTTLANPADLPKNFATSTTRTCGFNYPVSESNVTFTSDFSWCCSNTPITSNGCFNYCVTGYTVDQFRECILARVDIDAEVTCNIFPADVLGEKGSSIGLYCFLAGLFGAVVGFLLYCVID